MNTEPALEDAAIRPMRPADLDAVLDIEERNYSFPWSRGIFIDCLRAGYHCAVLEEAGDILGYAILSSAAAEAHILNICVDPDCQRRGLGRRLLQHLLGRMRALGIQRLFLEVRPSNAAALALYRQHGFERIGLRKAYYPLGGGEREDAWVLVLNLHPTGD